MNESNSDESIVKNGSSFRHRNARIWNKIVIQVDSRMSEAVAAYLADLSPSGIFVQTSSAIDREQYDKLCRENRKLRAENEYLIRQVETPRSR